MSDQSPIEPQDDGSKRMSSGVKLALMGVGAVALLYSCTPTVGGFRSMPSLFGFDNPFYRPPMAVTCPPGAPPNCDQTSRSGGSGGGGGGGVSNYAREGSGSASGGDSAGQTASSRGGFGSSASAHGEGGS